MPGYEATDLFGLGSNFSIQSSSTRETRERAMSLKANGDVACESGEFNVTFEYENVAEHCGATAGTRSDLGAKLTGFGGVFDSKVLTSLEHTLNNKAIPSLTLQGHQHEENAHTTGLRVYDVSALFPDGQGHGVDLSSLTADNAITISANGSFTGATFTASLEHMDSEGADGDHFDGQNRTCKVEVRLEGLGAKSTVTLGANWILDDEEDSDSNQESDTFSITAHQYVNAAV